MATEDTDSGAEEFTLRPGSREDLPDFLEVFEAATSGSGHPPETRSPEEVRAWARSVLDLPGRELWVAVRDEQSLGFALLEGDWLDLILVHPDRPGRGVGIALLDLVKSLRPRGFGLRVHQVNDRARAFYLRHGLVALERTDGSSYEDGQPDLQMAWLGDDPLAYLRRRIDAVDDELAVLLARRTALTAAVQDHKVATGEYAGERGRDAEREAEIVARMADQVPELGPEGLARVMHTVIEESLAAWETRPSGEADRARHNRPGG